MNSERNANGTFKKGSFTNYQGRTILGKPPVGRRPKNEKANERGLWQYQSDRPNCVNCKRKARYHTKNKDGSVKYWRNLCTMCHKNSSHKQYLYRLNKKDYCEKCGFKSIHECQLDVDHIDGNHKNNEESNLMTLCANCHRLKTVMSGEHNGVKYILYE